MNPKVSDAILFHLLFTIVMKTLFWSNTICTGLATFHCSYDSTKSEFWHEVQELFTMLGWISNTKNIQLTLWNTWLQDKRTWNQKKKKYWLKLWEKKYKVLFFLFPSFFSFVFCLFVCLVMLKKIITTNTNNIIYNQILLQRKHWALRPQKPLRLIRDGILLHPHLPFKYQRT